MDLPYAPDDFGNLLFLSQKSLESFASEFVAGRIGSKDRHGAFNRDGIFGT